MQRAEGDPDYAAGGGVNLPGATGSLEPAPQFCDWEDDRFWAPLFLLAVAFSAGVLGPSPFARVVELVDTQVSEACA